MYNGSQESASFQLYKFSSQIQQIQQMKLVILLAVTLVTFNCVHLGEVHIVEPKLPFDSNFSLRLKYAAQQKAPLADSTFTVSWNGIALATIVPKDYLVHRVFYNVKAVICQNQIDIQNSANNPGNHGVTIDDVELVRANGECGVEDVVENGNFMNGYDHVKGLINAKGSGWLSQSTDINIVLGREINQNWPFHNPVVHLTNGNDVYQQINFNHNFYQVSEHQCLQTD